MREFDITQTLQLKNNSEMLLHFTLGTQPPFLVLKPQPRARTSNSSNPPTGDSQPLVLQPQHSMQVRRGEAATSCHFLDDIHCSTQIFNERMFDLDIIKKPVDAQLQLAVCR